MKAGKIVNTMNTYYSYCNKIDRCVEKRNELRGWEDDYAVKEMDKKINRIKGELGKFLDTDV